MPTHSARGRQRSGSSAPCVEPLEDRILLSGTATPPYSHPPGGQSAHSYSPATSSSTRPGEGVTEEASRAPVTAPTYSPLAYVTGLLASLPSRDYYASHTGCPVAPPRAGPHREEAPSRPPNETPVAAPANPGPSGPALVSVAVSLLVAARVADRGEQPAPEVADDNQGGPPTAPAGQPAQEDEEGPTTAPLVALAAPALDLGDWDEAARQFLRSLEALGGDAAGPEAFWVRLGLWGLAAATTVVVFELFREHLIKRRVEALELAMSRRFREYDLTAR
jgi:hypothetical protein